MKGVVPHGHPVVIRRWEMGDFEVYPRKSGHAPGNVRDPRVRASRDTIR